MSAKTLEDYNKELSQLFFDAGRAQFDCTALKQALSREQDKLNNINQKIERVQKEARAAIAKQQAEQSAEEQPAPTKSQDEAANV